MLFNLLSNPTQDNINQFMNNTIDSYDFFTLYDSIETILAQTSFWAKSDLISMSYVMVTLGSSFRHKNIEHSILFYESELLHLLIRYHNKYGTLLPYEYIPTQQLKDEPVALLWLFLIPTTEEYQKRWYIPNGHELSHFYGLQCLNIMCETLHAWHNLGHDASSLGLYAEEVAMGCYLAWLQRSCTAQERQNILKGLKNMHCYLDPETIYACVIMGYIRLIECNLDTTAQQEAATFIHNYVLPYRPFFKEILESSH